MTPRLSARRLLVAIAGVVIGLTVACSGSPMSPSPGTGTPPPGATPTATPGPTPVPTPPTTGGGTGQTVSVIAAGDIGQCGSPGTAATARLVDTLPGQLFLAGDIAYLHGSTQDLRNCFDPFWGRFRTRPWYPVPGNHDYESPGAGPYFDYFGAAAGPRGLGYYSVTLGEWLVLMINSMVPVERGSAQWEFVRQELAAQRTPCTLAVWHYPLFSSGPNGPTAFMRDLWALLQEARAEVVINGHDHLYERFARQMADGRPEPALGVRQFTVGTGGAELYGFVRASPNSEARLAGEFGVLRLTLRPAIVEWQYITTAGRVFDEGLDTCR
jgi:hypothetical protein